jgi:hypothetical protein
MLINDQWIPVIIIVGIFLLVTLALAYIRFKLKSGKDGVASKTDTGVFKHPLKIDGGKDEGSNATSAFKTSGDVNGRLKSPLGSTLPGPEDIIEFAATEFLCSEEDPSVDVVVERRGPCSEALTVQWATENISVPKPLFAKLKQQGAVTFAPGEKRATVAVRVAADSSFNLGVALAVVLTVAEAGTAAGAATLGTVKRCKIVVLNADSFPAGETRLLEPLPVVAALMQHGYELFPKQTRWGLVYKLWPAVAMVSNLILTKYLLQTLTLVQLRSKAQKPTLIINTYIICALILSISYISYYVDLEYTKLRLGSVAKNLRGLIVGTSLDLASAVEQTYDVGRVLKVLSPHNHTSDLNTLFRLLI